MKAGANSPAARNASLSPPPNPHEFITKRPKGIRVMDPPLDLACDNPSARNARLRVDSSARPSFGKAHASSWAFRVSELGSICFRLVVQN